MAKNWVTFFSQTGSEILLVSKALNREPDLIVTNRTDLIGVNKELIELYSDKFVFIPRKPSEDDYRWLLKKYKDIFADCICTLHGYLRIIPSFLCEKLSNFYNGHPGLVSKYPELKGFNAQERAWQGGYKTAGSIIHEVTAGVDEGRILAEKEISIEGMSFDEVYSALHDNSVELWIDFLKEKFR